MYGNHTTGNGAGSGLSSSSGSSSSLSFSKRNRSNWTHQLALFFLGRKDDGTRIFKVVFVVMLLLYVAKHHVVASSGNSSGRYSSNGSPARRGDVDDIMPPENYFGASQHQQHGYLGYMPDGTPSWQPQPAPPTPEDHESLAAVLRDNGFFAALSDSISLDRNVSDFRDPLCKQQKYRLSELPSTSIIFVFHNEHLSTLLRSIHSVLNRSPPQLLKEIILVDDASTKSWLRAPLEHHIKYLPKVRLVRLPHRSGLVMARLKGVEEARAETFTILDSHIEVQEQWLEPLMWRLAKSPRTVVMPIIDSIDAATFVPQNGGIGCSLGFLWSLVEHSIDIQAKDQALRSSSIDPVRSPTMAGGLFAANRAFFYKIGAYDTQFGFWGAENLEFSFRIWQCGGTLECMPCSRVYHIFRQGGVPYDAPNDHLPKNRLRTAAIWMDEFGAVVRKTMANEKIDIGSLDAMKKLRENLQCKDFQWYLKEVYPESFITDMSDIVTMDVIRHEAQNVCLRAPYASDHQVVEVGPCTGDEVGESFLLHRDGELRPISNLELCVSGSLDTVNCEQRPRAHLWKVTEHKQLYNVHKDKCLTLTGSSISMEECADEEDAAQMWIVIPYKGEKEEVRRA